MENSARQAYGNPGGIKELVQARKPEVVFVPQKVWDPTGNHGYSARNWEQTTRYDVSVDEFVQNQDCSLIKVYNSTISRTDLSKLSVEEFLETNTLIANLFLSVEPDVSFWIDRSKECEEGL